jgi:polar amino acid transport system substrate-binding protein
MIKGSFFAAWLLVAASVASAGSSSLNVGVYPSYPPLDMKDPATGRVTGFDIELGEELARRMGATFDMQETSFAQLVASTQTGRINLFLNGMNDTAPRRELIAFVDYLQSGTQFLVRESDVAFYSNPESLCGKKVAGSRSTTFPTDLADWSKEHCESQGRPAIVYLGADNSIDARSQLKQGRADAMGMDSLTIPHVQDQEPGVYHTLGEPFKMTVMGIGVAKDNKPLQEALRSALQATIDDGAYAKLMAKWRLPATSALSRVTINMGL